MLITASRPRRLLLGLLVTATVATAVSTTTASAAATPGPFNPPPETTVTPNPDPQPCTGAFDGGILRVTTTVQGHTVTDADGTVHASGIQTLDIYEDWTDGSYMIAVAIGPVMFKQNAAGDQVAGGTQRFGGTLYSPTGEIVGYLDISTGFHYTFINGVFITNVGHFAVTRSPC